MKKTPLTVGIASIIPGLGLWFLGERKSSIVSAGITIGAFLVSILLFGKPLGQLAAWVFIISWVIQFSNALLRAGSNQKIQEGRYQAAQPMPVFRKPASRLSGKQASEYTVREIAKTQLRNGERIIKTFLGKEKFSYLTSFLLGPVAFLSTSWYCIALTQTDLLVIELDWGWKPLGVKRLPISDNITVLYKAKSSWLDTDTLKIALSPEKTLEVSVYTEKKQAQAIASVFNRTSSVST